MINISKKYITITATYCVVSLLLLGSAAFLLMVPESRSLDALTQDLEKIQQKHHSITETGSPQSKEDTIKHLEDVTRQLDDFVVDSEAAAKLTFSIRQIAADLKLNNFSSKRMESQSTEIDKELKNLGQIWIEVKFESSFNQFAKFVNQLERHYPVIFVEQFSLLRLQNEPKKASVKMGITFLTQNQTVAGL